MSSPNRSSGYFAGFRAFYLREPAPNRGRRMEPIHDSDAVVTVDPSTGEATARLDARPRFCPLTSSAIHGHADPMSVWKTFEVNVAECKKNADHEAPEPGCLCGFHAFKTLPELIKQERRHGDMVYCLVALGGEVIENETGYKAEEALIVAVVNTVGTTDLDYPADRVRRTGVPVIELSEIPAFAEEWDLEFLPHREPPPRVQFVSAEDQELYIAKASFPRDPEDVQVDPANEYAYEHIRVHFYPKTPLRPLGEEPSLYMVESPFVTLKKWRVVDRNGTIFVFWVPVGSSDYEADWGFEGKQELMNLATYSTAAERRFHTDKTRPSDFRNVSRFPHRRG